MIYYYRKNLPKKCLLTIANIKDLNAGQVAYLHVFESIHWFINNSIFIKGKHVCNLYVFYNRREQRHINNPLKTNILEIFLKYFTNVYSMQRENGTITFSEHKVGIFVPKAGEGSYSKSTEPGKGHVIYFFICSHRFLIRSHRLLIRSHGYRP